MHISVIEFSRWVTTLPLLSFENNYITTKVPPFSWWPLAIAWLWQAWPSCPSCFLMAYLSSWQLLSSQMWQLSSRYLSASCLVAAPLPKRRLYLCNKPPVKIIQSLGCMWAHKRLNSETHPAEQQDVYSHTAFFIVARVYYSTVTELWSSMERNRHPTHLMNEDVSMCDDVAYGLCIT